MGYWHIAIDGAGMHHNFDDKYPGGLPDDAQVLFRKIISELKDRGQTIFHATLTFGGIESLEPMPSPSGEAPLRANQVKSGF